MSNTTSIDAFRHQLGNTIQMATVNYFEDVFASAGPVSALPPKETQVLNITNYKKQFNQKPILCWGEDNQYPTHIDEQAKKSSVFEGGYKVLCDHLRGQGFGLAIPTFKDGKRVLEPVDDEDMMQMLYDIGYYEYWHDACGELPMWGQVAPLYKLNSRREIAQIRANDFSRYRFERPNPTNGYIQNMYESTQWVNGIDKSITGKTIPDEYKNYIFKYPLLDRYDYVDQITGLKKNFSFVSHHKFHSRNSIYGRAPWHSLYDNRWLSISGKVPEMIIRYYEAAMTINYLFYINEEFLIKKFPEYEKWDDSQKAEKIKELQKSYEDNLKGTNNAMKSLLLTFKYDKQNGKEVKNMLVDTIDNKMREGKFIPDSQISDGQILFTLGLDPSLIGVVIPGGKQTAGSGSNIREASLALQMRLRPDRELNHTPFYVWRDYTFGKNKSDKRNKYVIVTNDYLIDTLDKRATTSASETTPTN